MKEVESEKMRVRPKLRDVYTPPPLEVAVHEVNVHAESVMSADAVFLAKMAPPLEALQDVNVQGDDALVVNLYPE